MHYRFYASDKTYNLFSDWRSNPLPPLLNLDIVSSCQYVIYLYSDMRQIVIDKTLLFLFSGKIPMTNSKN